MDNPASPQGYITTEILVNELASRLAWGGFDIS
jgi:hypothetical protein